MEKHNVVVEFTSNENSRPIGVVLRKWIINNKTCYWPGDNRVKTYLQHGVNHAEGWEEYPINIIESFEKLEEALHFTVQLSADDDSDVTVMNRGNKRPVKRRIDKDFYPTPLNKLKKMKPKNSDLTGNVYTEPLSSFTDIMSLDEGNICEATNEIAELTNIPFQPSNLDEQCSKEDVKYLKESIQMIHIDIKSYFKSLSDSIMSLQASVNEVKGQTPVESGQSIINSNPIIKLFPLTTKDEFKEANEVIRDDSKVKDMTIKYFCSLGGADGKKACRNCLQRVFSHTLALQIGWTGKKSGKSSSEKTRLKDTPLMDCIIAAVQFSYRNTSEEIGRCAMRWIQHTLDRFGGRKRREKKKEGRSEYKNSLSSSDED